MMNKRTMLALTVLPALLLAACGGSDDNLDDRLGVADPKLRMVHAVPGAPVVTLFRDGQAQTGQVANVPYKGASNYIDVATSTNDWEVRTGTTPAVAVGGATFEAQRGHKYTLIAVPDAGSLTDVVLIDDPYDKGVTSDDARARVFNAAFNAASVDIYLTAPGINLATVAPNFAAVGFKQALPASGADSISLDGGTYTLRMTTAGTKSVIFTATVTLADNADWLLLPVPASASANDLRVLVIQSDAGAPATELVNQP